MNHSFELATAPGHLIRRSHQISVAVFNMHLAAADVTPVQFAILNALMDEPGLDQVTLAAKVAFDAATSGSVIGRLEARGWIRREQDPQDRRRKLLWATEAGAKAALDMKDAAERVQTRLLAPLNPAEQEQLTVLLEKLVDGYAASPLTPPLANP